MAYREVDMWEILEVLRRLHRKETNAAIERATGRTRKTIRRYKQRARKLDFDPRFACFVNRFDALQWSNQR